MQPNEILKIAGLTSLTKLELNKWQDWFDLEPLQVLPLEELVMIDCNNLEIDLFEHGALTALRKLHIEDSCWKFKTDLDGFVVHGQYTEAFTQQLQQVGEIIMALPHLQQVSGACSLYKLGIMEEMLQTWRMSEYEWNVGHMLRLWIKYWWVTVFQAFNNCYMYLLWWFLLWLSVVTLCSEALYHLIL